MAGNYFNALMDPAQIGQMVQGAIMAGAQTRAMSNYAKNPSMGAAGDVAAFDPRLGMHLQDREAERQAAQEERAKQQQEAAWRNIENLAKIARSAKDEPSYQRALQFAANLGIDTTGAPPNFDPNWVAQKAQELEFFAGPQGREALSNAGKQAVDMGLTPGTPEYAQTVTQLVEAGLAQPYTDSEGATRLYTPSIRAPSPPPPEQTPQGPLSGQIMPFESYVGFARALSPEDAAEWAGRGQVFAVQTPEQAAQLPRGATYITPDGQMMRIP